MSWPSPQEYNEAMQMAALCFKDPELQKGNCQLTKLGLPKVTTGAFASVYRFRCATRDVAVRCFLHRINDVEQRYAEISDFIMTDNLPYTVSFEYQREGVLVRGRWYPILKMDWVEGVTLTDYLEQNFRSQVKLQALISKFKEMMSDLRAAGIAHGDLQHGNILVVDDDQLRLVDYDGMYVPALAGWTSNELGHRNYQHPGRTKYTFGSYLDNFSAWVIHSALISLSLDVNLWHDFGVGDECLLLRQADYQNSSSSRMFLRLLSHKQNEISGHARLLQHFVLWNPKDIPELNSAISLIKIPPLAISAAPGSLLRDYVASVEQPLDVTDLWSSNNIEALTAKQIEHLPPTADVEQVIQLLRSGKQEEAVALLTRNISFEDLLIQRARGEIKLGNYDEAVRNLDQVLRIAPENADAHLDLGIALVAAGQFGTALNVLDRARQLAPADSRCSCFRAVALQGLAMHPEALTNLQECIKTAADHKLRSRAYDLAVISYCALERYSDARKSYESARTYNPRGSITDEVEQAYNVSRGFIAVEGSLFDEATEHFHRSKELTGSVIPELIDFGLAVVDMAKGNYQWALQQFAQVEKRGFKSKLMYYLIGIALAEKDSGVGDQTNRALAAFTTALRIGNNPSLDAEIHVAWSKVLKGANQDPVLRKEKLLAAITLNPLLAGAHSALAELYEAEGNLRGTLHHYNVLADLEPQNPEWCLKIGSLNLAWKNYAEAQADFTNAIARREHLPEAYYLRSLASTKLKLYQKAIADLTQCLEYNPQHATAWCSLATNYYFIREDEKAEETVNTALSLKPNWIMALKLRARILYSRTLYKEAMADCNSILESVPTDNEIKILRGKCAGRQGMHTECIADLQTPLLADPSAIEDQSCWGILAESLAAIGNDELLVNAVATAYKHRVGLLDAELAMTQGRAFMRLHARTQSPSRASKYCEQAVEAFSRYCKLRPNESAGFMERATARRNSEEFFANIVSDYQAAIAIDDSPLAHLGLAITNLGPANEAMTKIDRDPFTFPEVLNTHKSSPSSLQKQGIASVLNTLKSSPSPAGFKQGIASFDRAVKLDPDLAKRTESAICWRWKGAMAAHNGNSEGAMEAYNKAVEADPKDQLAYYWRAALLITLDRHDLALQDLDQISAPYGESVKVAYAECFYRIGRYKEAMDVLAPLEDRSIPNSAAVYVKALCLEASGDHRQTIAELTRLLTCDPVSIPYRLIDSSTIAEEICRKLIELCTKSGDGRAALDAFRKLSRTPENYIAISHGAFLKCNQGEYAEAIKDFDFVIKTAKERLTNGTGSDSALLQKFFCGRANAFIKSGRLPKAEEDIKRAFELGRSYGTLLESANLHVQRKRFNDALTVLQEAEKLESSDAALYDLYAIAHARTGGSDQAAQALKRSAELRKIGN